MEFKKVMVLIPTYNEKDSIENIIFQIFNHNPGFFVTVIDDNSSDGTGQLVDRLKETFKNLYIIHRNGKLGLGTAYIEGFKYAISQGMDFVIQMDADFSHDPKYLADMLKETEYSDVVIGSRYVNGVRVDNWPFRRLLLSKIANIYVRMVTGIPIEDATSGFKCIKTQAIRSLDLDKIISNGYAFQVEVVFKLFRKGFKIKEFPIVFYEREQGRSKMSRKIVFEAVWKVLWLKLSSFFIK
ncbi:MAG: polyprenol monophosphomannose synthase [Candidatus Omnitrophica bacterium]|nr:polyprenol monophosphomannose synthase [Candidatus Omnitrophota bacterium]